MTTKHILLPGIINLVISESSNGFNLEIETRDKSNEVITIASDLTLEDLMDLHHDLGLIINNYDPTFYSDIYG